MEVQPTGNFRVFVSKVLNFYCNCNMTVAKVIGDSEHAKNWHFLRKIKKNIANVC